MNAQTTKECAHIYASPKTQSIQKSLKWFNFKHIVNKQFHNPKRNKGKVTFKKFNKKINVKSFKIEGFQAITISTKQSTNKHLVYLHGGAYVIQASKAHRKLIEKFATNYNFRVTFIDYPLAPENTYKTTHRVLLAIYKKLIKLYPNDEFILIGDSAGGGLALAFAQVLRDKRIKPFPSKTILLSPWLDISMSNEQIAEYESKDNILPVEGLKYTAKLYSGGDNLQNPLLSPIFGNMNNLGDILLFFGTKEVFYPDCIELTDKINNSDSTTVNCVIGEGMMHDWIIFSSPETDTTIKIISDFISN